MAQIIDISDSSPRLHPQKIPNNIGVIDITNSEPDDEQPLFLPASRDTGEDEVHDPYSNYLALVLEIVPDVDPEHALSLIKSHHETHQTGLLEPVLHNLFEDKSYPKVDKGKGKRKREDEESNQREKSRKIDLGSKDRPLPDGPHYRVLALDQLYRDFPYVPVTHIRHQLAAHNGLYAPTYLFIAAEKTSGKLPYKVKSTASRVASKGKSVEIRDDHFEAECEWLAHRLRDDASSQDAKLAEEINEKEYEESGGGIECGCCFTAYPFDKMVQCPDAHLFCTECMISYSENELGSHNTNLVCMDQSGCKLTFPFSELRRFLTPKLLDLYERVKQRKDIEMAGIENLEECPHCDFKVVIDNPDERLFRCQNADCGTVTCRKCKKADHLPKSCEEVEQDNKLDARHVIEEAMSKALVRNCPKCQKAFVKELGCNKMSCPNCHTLSCYVCRQVIHGYDHFNNVGTGSRGKCNLHDGDGNGVDRIHNEEVAAAAKKAMEDYKRDHPEIDDKDLQVELPKAGPSTQPAQAVPGMAWRQALPAFIGGGMGALQAPVPVPPNLNFNAAPNLFNYPAAALQMGGGRNIPPVLRPPPPRARPRRGAVDLHRR